MFKPFVNMRSIHRKKEKTPIKANPCYEFSSWLGQRLLTTGVNLSSGGRFRVVSEALWIRIEISVSTFKRPICLSIGSSLFGYLDLFSRYNYKRVNPIKKSGFRPGTKLGSDFVSCSFGIAFLNMAPSLITLDLGGSKSHCTSMGCNRNLKKREYRKLCRCSGRVSHRKKSIAFTNPRK